MEDILHKPVDDVCVLDPAAADEETRVDEAVVHRARGRIEELLFSLGHHAAPLLRHTVEPGADGEARVLRRTCSGGAGNRGEPTGRRMLPTQLLRQTQCPPGFTLDLLGSQSINSHAELPKI